MKARATTDEDDEKEPIGPPRAGRVAIVGRPNVGKSTLLNAALEQPLAIVSPTPQTTRDALLGVVHHKGAEIALLDTPGLHRPQSELGRVMNRTAREAAREADVLVFVTDLPEDKPQRGGSRARGSEAAGAVEKGKPRGGETEGGARGARGAEKAGAGRARGAEKAGGTPEARGAEKAGAAREPRPLTPHTGDLTLLADLGTDAPIVLVINKIDRMRDKTRLFPLLEALSKVRSFAAVVPISALKTDGVLRVLDEVAKLCPEGEPKYGVDDLTDRPVRFFAGEYVREQILRATAEEVPHSAAVVIDDFVEPAGPGAVRIEATIHVERPGQKKILIGAGGEMLKRIGTRARLRIEELTGRKVHLALWVRVTPSWRESPERLEELGYGKSSRGGGEGSS